MLCNSTPIFLIFVVKLICHSGRPYLNKIELADMTLHEYTSAEFGMPSGHSASSIMSPLMFYYYFTRLEYKMYWDQRTIRKYIILSIVLAYAFAVAYSRIYTGRHTLDQCIAGFLIGFWCTNFYWYIYKPHLYDRSQMVKERTNQFFYFKLTLVIFIFKVVIVYYCYQQVNENITLPP
jgi:membrane-associated phospholipid phosphatase